MESIKRPLNLLRYKRGLLLGYALTTAALLCHTSFASKPNLKERSLSACQALESSAHHLQVLPISPQAFFPLTTVISSRKCSYIPCKWREGDMYSKDFPSAGLALMYNTAETAADEIIQKMKIHADTPQYDPRDVTSGAAATLDLMRQADPPEYIRKSVLIREGVLMVVPILKRLAKKSSHTGKPLYIPVVIKGHQELDDEDELTAAFAAWALEPWLDQFPAQAEIHLRPMVEKRTSRADMKPIYTIDVAFYIPQVNEIFNNFRNLVADAEARRLIKPRRCTQCNVCPWAAKCREEMQAVKDLSMMPFPPKAPQAEILGTLGYGDLDKLASLDINSDAFMTSAMITGISAEDLRYYVARSVAQKRDDVLVMESYEDPFKDLDYLIHIDFEDLLIRNIKSGVYLFGVLVEDKTKTTTPEEVQSAKSFFIANELTQGAIDEQFAKFIKFIKTDPRFASGKYKLTIYSKHEVVKFEQEFDVLKQQPQKFTKEERQSPFYSEVMIHDKPMGRLIRNVSFFKKYPDLKPQDVFNILDRCVDLLQYFRMNLAAVGHTNGIKYILGQVAEGDPNAAYPPDWNGLSSMAWALEYYRRQEPEIIEKAKAYNTIDILGNYFVARFISEHAGQPITPTLYWKKQTKKILPLLDESVQLRRMIANLSEKEELIAIILGRELRTLSFEQRMELADILNRSAYLKKRKQVHEDPRLSDEESAQVVQGAKFELKLERREHLYRFFKKINPTIGENSQDPATKAMVDLISRPTNFFTPIHVEQIVLFEILRGKMKKITWSSRGDFFSRLRMPKKVEKAMPKVEGLTQSNLKKYWEALYLFYEFKG